MSGGRGQRRIVLDLPNWLGDVIHTLPALFRLLESGAAAAVTALAPAAYLPLVALTGAVASAPTKAKRQQRAISIWSPS